MNKISFVTRDNNLDVYKNNVYIGYVSTNGYVYYYTNLSARKIILCPYPMLDKAERIIEEAFQ